MSKKERTIALVRRLKQVSLVAPRQRAPRQQHPTMIAVEYAKTLQPLVKKAHALVERSLLPYLPAMIEANARAHEAARRDAELGDLTGLLHKLARSAADLIEPKQFWWIADQFGRRTSDFQKQQLNLAVRAVLGVDITRLEPHVTERLDGWIASNVSLIRSLPTQYVTDIEKNVMDAVRQGTRWEQLSETLQERKGITERRADLIARDQVGKLYGDLNQGRQRDLGVTGYIWRTSLDERVRDEHDEREGDSFDWSDPPEDGHPGEPVLCRCYAEPDFSPILEDL